MFDLREYRFTAEQIAYVDSHSDFTLRDMANVIDWIEKLDQIRRAKVDALTLAQQVAVHRMTDETRETFFADGMDSPITAYLAEIT